MWIILLLSLLNPRAFAASPPANFISNPNIQQCTAALPTVGWMGFDHTWLVTLDNSFGMPYSLTRDAVRGGFASIRSPDPSLANLTSPPVCQPIYQPENISTTDFTEKFLCLMSKLSDSDENILPEWQPIFVYQWAVTNCHSSVRFMLDCAGGKMPLNPNGGLGSQYSSDQVLNIFKVNPNNQPDPEAMLLKDNFQKLVQTLKQLFQEQGNIEAFLTENIPLILSESLALKKSLNTSQDLRRMGLYRRLQKFDNNFKKLTSQMQIAPTLEGIENLTELSQIFNQPDILQKTYQQICEQAQKECP